MTILKHLLWVVPPVAALWFQPAWPEEFVPDDRIVSDPAIHLTDPEFNSIDNKMVWQDTIGNLWVADVDPVTGDISPSTAQGILVDTGLASISTTRNGPEWAFGNGQGYIVYTKASGGRVQLASAQDDGVGGWSASPLENGKFRRSPLGTPSSNTMAPRISYVRSTSGTLITAWRDLEDPLSEKTLAEVVAKGGHWAEDQHVLLALENINGTDQAVSINTDTAERTQLTFDPENKIAPKMSWAPEYGDFIMEAVISDTAIGIYQLDNGNWNRTSTITVPSPLPYYSSPEPFVVNDRSYIAIVVSTGLTASKLPTGPSEIWVVGIDETTPFWRRVNDPTVSANRSEPEIFYTIYGPVIFYSQKNSGTGKLVLRRAATGLITD